MSRSYREPYVVDGYGSPRKRKAKNYANRVVRHSVNVPSGNAYRKFNQPYDICDYKWLQDKICERRMKVDGRWQWVIPPWNKWRCK